jgi:hypothetical protein
MEVAVTATGHSANFSRLHALNAAGILKYHSNPAVASRYIAALAIIKSK